MNFQIGDKVRINEKSSYFEGVTGTVININSKSIEVKVDDTFINNAYVPRNKVLVLLAYKFDLFASYETNKEARHLLIKE